MAATFLPKLAPIQQISPRITRILGLNPSAMTLQGTNSYLIGGSSPGRLLIDTSNPDRPDYVANLRSVLASARAVLTDILITHWHPDHVGSVVDVQSMASELTGRTPRIHKFPSTSPHPEVNFSWSTLKDGATLRTEDGQCSLRVLHTPGHTDDHVCLLLEEENTLFSGDLVLGHGSTTFEQLTPYMASLESMRALNPTPSLLLPGHGDMVTEPLPKLDEYISHRRARIDQVENVLRAAPGGDWMKEEAILAAVYPDLDSTLVPAAWYNMRHALHYLSDTKAVEFRPDAEVDSSGSAGMMEWRSCGQARL